MPATLDRLMEDASAKLVAMDYAGCEATCLKALEAARKQRDWIYYARILLPLQEARRQRRLTAADTLIQLGTAARFVLPRVGCIVVTRPHGSDDVKRWQAHTLEHALQVELLWCDAQASDTRWTLRCPNDPTIQVEVDAPRGFPLNQAIDPAHTRAAAHWFVAASEALGDAALATVTAPLGSLDRITRLEELVAAVSDHEILHQRLGDAARAMKATATR